MSSSPAPTHIVPGFNADLPAGARRSHALEAITTYLRTTGALHVIDLGGVNQANLDYITGLGHRLYTADLLRAYDSFFDEEERTSRVIQPARVEAFLEHTLDFPDQSTDGALVWDALQFLPPLLAQAILDRLHRILAPDSILLAFFHPDSAGQGASPHACRILDNRHLQLQPRAQARACAPYNTRSIERFFQRFTAVKFFLSRENLQEVVARR